MTEFEKQVAEALLVMLDTEAAKPYDGKTPRDFFREQVAPRMAAAIQAAWHETVEPDHTVAKVQAAAVAALRGEAP